MQFLAVTWAAVNPILKHFCVASAYMVKNDVVSFILESGFVQQEAHDGKDPKGTKSRGVAPADPGA